MRAYRRWHVVVALVTTTAALLSCNAILGVEDVSPMTNTTRRRDAGDREDEGGGDEERDSSTDPQPEEEDRNILALGFLHGCGRLPSGRVKCWGANFEGELGDGVPLDSPTRLDESNRPIEVPGIDDAISIASGNSHTCVVHKTGKVSCWGSNDKGQLGNGTTDPSSSPVEATGITTATRVIAGTNFTCALLADRTVSCWGQNASGQLGDGTVDDRPTPAPVKELEGVVSLSAGFDHACAVLRDGGVMCWGKNGTGQLGIGSTSDSRLPTKLTALSNVVQVAGASGFSCARQRTGRVFCWGDNAEGQLGNGSPTAAPNPSPILVPSLGDATWIWAGYEHACAVRKAGEVVCWGRGQEGQLGIEAPDGAVVSPVPTPTPVVGVPPATLVFTGGDRACALTKDLAGMCWGSNAFGQLANGTNVTPARKATPMVDWP